MHGSAGRGGSPLQAPCIFRRQGLDGRIDVGPGRVDRGTRVFTLGQGFCLPIVLPASMKNWRKPVTFSGFASRPAIANGGKDPISRQPSAERREGAWHTKASSSILGIGFRYQASIAAPGAGAL